MSAVSEPGACPQNIHGCGCEKCLKPKLFVANVARSPHLTRAHSLRNGAFNSCSFGIQCPKFRCFLAFACFLEGSVGLFIWTQNEHFRCGLCTSIMERTRSTHRERKPDPQAWLPMPIGDMTPISAGLPSRTDHPFGLPINEKVAVLKTVRCFCCPTRVWNNWSNKVNLIAHLAPCEHVCIDISCIYQMLMGKNLMCRFVRMKFF